jgi:hypothetical protein
LDGIWLNPKYFKIGNQQLSPILGKFNDYSGRKYNQAIGSGGHLER